VVRSELSGVSHVKKKKKLKTDYYFPEVLWYGLFVGGQKM